MPRLHTLVLVAAVVLAAPRTAFALATEQFGNAPVDVVQWNLPADTAGVVNLTSRVYWYEVNGWPCFYYRGDVDALNEAFVKFAAVKTEHKQIRLLAGPGERSDLGRKKTFAYDWSVSVPGGFVGIGANDPVVMVVHVTVPRPTAKPDEADVKKQIGELDGPKFAAREAATRKLRDLGFAGVPYFQAALKATESAETRTRLEGLLGRLKGIDLQRLDLPAGVPVLGPEDQFAFYRRLTADPSPITRGRAVYGLVACQVEPSTLLAELTKLLEKETDEYPLRCLAGAVGPLGAQAKPLLPLLKKQITFPDANVKTAFAEAVKVIEAAKPAEPAADAAKLAATLRSEVQQAATAGGGRKKATK